jgi:hypothetical protein
LEEAVDLSSDRLLMNESACISASKTTIASAILMTIKIFKKCALETNGKHTSFIIQGGSNMTGTICV